MKTRILGQSGVALSRVVLGCGTFGGIGSPRHLIGRGLDRDAAQATMDEALALGINLFDTAHSYAGLFGPPFNVPTIDFDILPDDVADLF